MKQLGHRLVMGPLDKYLDYLQSVGLAARTVSTGGEGSQAATEKLQRMVARGSMSPPVPAL